MVGREGGREGKVVGRVGGREGRRNKGEREREDGIFHTKC